MKHIDFICQKEAIKQLEDYCKCNAHSILIEGAQGSGKSYLAQMYAKNMLNIEDFYLVSPTVQNIRAIIEDCYKLSNPIVIIIENLDLGVKAASYTLLKFLEEPVSHAYVVVTCRNIKNIPDTIVSRSLTVTTSPPIDVDIDKFASEYNSLRFNQIHNKDIWACVHTFKDAQIVLDMSDSQISYFDSIRSILTFKDSISNMMWKLGHYEDNSETPIEIVIEYIMFISNDRHIKKAGIDCMRDISNGRIAQHAAIAKFLFEAKYCE